MCDDLANMKAREIAAKIHTREISSVETAEYFLARIEKLNPEINAFIHVDRDFTLKQAEVVDKRINNNDIPSPLAGVPAAFKDNIQVAGMPTTCASKILTGYTSVYDAGLTSNIKKAGLVIIGKTNMDEFAMGSSNEFSYYGAVKNPLDKSKVPGGSSGGSAAAVAAGMTPLSFGSDTGGSVRLPGAFCGLAALRPSYGRISRYGLVAFASSFDQIGPIASDVADLSGLLSIGAGYDKRDSTCTDTPAPDYSSELAKGLRGLKVGIPAEYFGEGIDQPVREAIENVIDSLRKDNIEIADISLPMTKYCTAVYYIIANAEASANLARYDGVRYGWRSAIANSLDELYYNTRTEGFGAEVKRRIMLGTFVLSAGYYDAYYRRALKIRSLISEDFDRAFRECDIILSPTSPSTAFGFDERINDPLRMYLSDVFTAASPLAKIPALSIPIGKDPNDMPIGLQLMGKYFDEQTILRGAYHIERMLGNG
ncbi:MAG: Asp-tRNA(Asn)/Glu-tRNA(Gln) amidotransferase subunit GatA [candidate division Zixibacteria bacterium]|nr:Asp-tRNA(Asn)/Glu-tRNA(Gln) amidotransferase subunit GatA [candidate division Zixibacteria bacterium]